MKRWIILLVVLPLAGVCFAEMDSNQVSVFGKNYGNGAENHIGQ